MKRVVITGIGVVSPLGNDLTTFWNNVKEGNHGITKITKFDASDFPIKVAAEVKDFDPLLCMEKKDVKKRDIYCQYALEATRQAIEDCGSDFQDVNPYRVGVLVGTGIGGIHTIEDEYEFFLTKKSRPSFLYAIPKLISNMAAGEIAMKYGFKGKNFNISSACATSTNTIGEAFSSIKLGKMDVCIAGGSEATITPFTLTGFHSMKTLTTSDDPDRASIPFDKERNGFVMGEGAGIVVLEELEHALNRNAKIYAEVVGYGATADAYHITSPEPQGEAAAQAILEACAEAGIEPKDVDYFNAHGTSTPLNDKYETNAIKRAFGDSAKNLYISSTKSMTGHLLGGAGAIEAIISALSLKDGFIPMTVGYKEYDEDCDLNYVTEQGLEKDITYAMSNSLGFGGHNAVLCIKKYKE